MAYFDRNVKHAECTHAEGKRESERKKPPTHIILHRHFERQRSDVMVKEVQIDQANHGMAINMYLYILCDS